MDNHLPIDKESDEVRFKFQVAPANSLLLNRVGYGEFSVCHTD